MPKIDPELQTYTVDELAKVLPRVGRMRRYAIARAIGFRPAGENGKKLLVPRVALIAYLKRGGAVDSAE